MEKNPIVWFLQQRPQSTSCYWPCLWDGYSELLPCKLHSVFLPPGAKPLNCLRNTLALSLFIFCKLWLQVTEELTGFHKHVRLCGMERKMNSSKRLDRVHVVWYFCYHWLIAASLTFILRGNVGLRASWQDVCMPTMIYSSQMHKTKQKVVWPTWPHGFGWWWDTIGPSFSLFNIQISCQPWRTQQHTTLLNSQPPGLLWLSCLFW